MNGDPYASEFGSRSGNTKLVINLWHGMDINRWINNEFRYCSSYTVVHTFQFLPLLFYFQFLLFSRGHCPTYQVFLSLSTSVSAVQFWILLSLHSCSVSASAVQLQFLLSVSVSALLTQSSKTFGLCCSVPVSSVKSQTLLCVHSCPNLSVSFSAVSV